MPSSDASRPSSHAAGELLLPIAENRFARTALGRLTRKTAGDAPRLVYLYGPAGVGKSHLVRQFLRDDHRSRPGLRIAAVTASEFAAELAQASEGRTIDRFQRRYRELDLFVCEDLRSLEGRRETQQQLVAVLDEITAAGGRVVLTARKSPGELTPALPRLINRCHGGVCAAVALPGRASRIQLLTHFAAARQIPLPLPVVETLSDALAVSPRELLAAVINLETCSRHERAPIDGRLVQRYLDGELKPQVATLAQIAQAVARHFGVSVAALRGQARPQGIVLPRQYAMFLSRELTREPLHKIARFFGRSNHSTVIHACNRLKTLLNDDPALRQRLILIQHALGAEAPSWIHDASPC